MSRLQNTTEFLYTIPVITPEGTPIMNNRHKPDEMIPIFISNDGPYYKNNVKLMTKFWTKNAASYVSSDKHFDTYGWRLIPSGSKNEGPVIELTCVVTQHIHKALSRTDKKITPLLSSQKKKSIGAVTATPISLAAYGVTTMTMHSNNELYTVYPYCTVAFKSKHTVRGVCKPLDSLMRVFSTTPIKNE